MIRKIGPEAQPKEWRFPLPGYRLVRLLVKDPSGAGLLFVLRSVSQLLKKAKQSSKNSSKQFYPASLCLAYAAALLVLLIWSGKPLFLLYAWSVPLFCILPAILRICSIAEHFALPKAHILNESRVIHPARWESFLLAPHHVSLHLDHHLFPYVPWYRLLKLHKRLLATDEYQTLAHVNSRFFFGKKSLLEDITRIQDDPSSPFKG